MGKIGLSKMTQAILTFSSLLHFSFRGRRAIEKGNLSIVIKMELSLGTEEKAYLRFAILVATSSTPVREVATNSTFCAPGLSTRTCVRPFFRLKPSGTLI